MKFSEIITLAQKGEIQIGAVSLRRLEILWAGAQFTSLYSLSSGGVWEYCAGADRSRNGPIAIRVSGGAA